MTHYIIELALWILLAFFIGCLIGWLLRSLFGSASATEAVDARPVETSAPQAVAAVVPETVVAPAVAAPLAAARMERPRGLGSARGGKADDLQRISGIGPKNEKILHNLGVFHFDQIASWAAEQVAWVDDHLKFNGRILREHWIEQAALLAEGNDEEFRRLYGSGGLKNETGVTEAGARTRKS